VRNDRRAVIGPAYRQRITGHHDQWFAGCRVRCARTVTCRFAGTNPSLREPRQLGPAVVHGRAALCGRCLRSALYITARDGPDDRTAAGPGREFVVR
jgi:hypothetical protein